MTLTKFICALAAGTALTLPALAAEDHKGHDHAASGSHAGHDDKARHGGNVSVEKDINYELVVKPDTVSLYVSDHGQPVELKDASAKLTLLSAQGKTEATLAPVGDRLEAKGSFKGGVGTKAMATVTLAGQAPTNVRFSLK